LVLCWSFRGVPRAGSGIFALVNQPFAVFCRREVLIAILASRYYAWRSSAANVGIFGVAVWAAEALT
jgi:hypothetical protein